MMESLIKRAYQMGNNNLFHTLDSAKWIQYLQLISPGTCANANL